MKQNNECRKKELKGEYQNSKTPRSAAGYRT